VSKQQADNIRAPRVECVQKLHTTTSDVKFISRYMRNLVLIF